MASEYIKFLSNKKIICDTCKKGYIEPQNKDIPREKATLFVCTNCGEMIRIVKKLKID